MQDDALIGNLTVEETLRYVLELRIPKSELSEKKRQLRIASLLADLNLTKVRNSRVSTKLRNCRRNLLFCSEGQVCNVGYLGEREKD